MSWKLLKAREKSENVEINVITNESTEDEDNRFRQEYDMFRTGIPTRQQFEFVKLLYTCVRKSKCLMSSRPSILQERFSPLRPKLTIFET